MDRKKFSLIFFDQLPDSHLESEFVLSGLQAFETGLFLMSEGRWPSTTLILWEACEKLLRVVAAKNNEKDLDAIALQGMFKRKNNALSDSLNRRSHEFRSFRNTIAHEGYSPKDDDECLRLFFEAGVPYFDSLLRYLFDADKKDLSGEAGEWFWRIYSDTRKVLEKKRKNGITSRGQSLSFLQLASKKVFSILNVAQGLYLGDERLSIIAEHFQDDEWDIEQMIRNEAIENLGNNQRTWCVELKEPGCPICGSSWWETLAEIEWEWVEAEKEHRFLDVKKFVCLKGSCASFRFLIVDPEVVDVFCKSKLSPAIIEYLGSEECQPVEQM